jgi:uncharacterized protein (DUF2249 family)
MRGEGSSQRTCPTGGVPGGSRGGVRIEAAVADGRTACLDLRRLPAPEPMERALQAVDALAPGAELVLLTPLMPVPLLQVLEQRGFQVDARLSPDWSARVTVRAPSG